MAAVVEHSFRVKGMDCATCAAKVEAAVRKVTGTSDVEVSVHSETMTVRLDPSVVGRAAVAQAVESIGYTVECG